jgi:hypothetical protein
VTCGNADAFVILRPIRAKVAGQAGPPVPRPAARAGNQIFYGWIGDVRNVNRPLAVSEFMIPDFVANFEKWG